MSFYGIVMGIVLFGDKVGINVPQKGVVIALVILTIPFALLVGYVSSRRSKKKEEKAKAEAEAKTGPCAPAPRPIRASARITRSTKFCSNAICWRFMPVSGRIAREDLSKFGVCGAGSSLELAGFRAITPSVPDLLKPPKRKPVL